MKLYISILLLSLVLAEATQTYTHSMKLSKEHYQSVMNYTVPHIVNRQIVYAIRDVDTKGKFSWTTNHSISPINSTHDCLSFFLPKEWPENLGSMVIDFAIFTKTSKIRVVSLKSISYQTHLEISMNQAKPPSLILYPVGFSNFQLTGGFSYMVVPEYEMFPIHYMHMHNGQHDDVMSEKIFQGNWIDFMAVVIDADPIEGKKCNKIDMDTEDQGFAKQNIAQCPYFVGLKGFSKYGSKAEVFLNGSLTAVKDFNKDRFIYSGFPLPSDQFIDDRTFFLQFSMPSAFHPSILQQTVEQYPIVAIIFIGSIVVSIVLVIYAKIVIRMRQSQEKVFKDEKSETFQKHTTTCSICKNQMTISDINTRNMCQDCRKMISEPYAIEQ